MKANERGRERGQTLVVVALVIVVLMLMAGLAVDVGMAYNERRDLQNAADAAALAGAQQLCDGKGEAAAVQAAIAVGQANGATTVDPQPSLTETARRMRVVVNADADVFFFRLAGIESVPVSATATAECSCAAAVGGAWPIAFDKPQWDDLGCRKSDGTIVGGSPYILVWVDDNVDTGLGEDLCTLCDCEPFIQELGISSIVAYGGNPMSTGDRGWIRLKTPVGFENDPVFGGQNNCGASLKTWMEYGYPGQLVTGKCVPTQGGVDNAALAAADRSKFTDVAIVLYEPGGVCTAGDLVDGNNSCPGNWLRIAGTGCVQVHKVYYGSDSLTLKRLNGNQNCRLGSVNIVNIKAIVASKSCDCPYTGQGSAGGPHSTTCVPAVSLVE